MRLGSPIRVVSCLAGVFFAVRAPSSPMPPLREGLACLRTSDLRCAQERLGEALQDAKSPIEKTKARLLLARTHLEAGRPEEALATLQQVPTSEIPAHLTDLFLFERARALVALSRPEAAAALREFLRVYPSSDRADEARNLLAREALKSGGRQEAATLARQVLDGRSGTPLKSEALLTLADASPDERDALKKRLFIEYPHTQAAARAGLDEAALSAAELARRARAFHEAYDYEEYQRIEEALWTAGLKTPERARDLALSHLNLVRDDPRRSIELLEVAERGGAISHAEAIWWKARAHAKLEDYDQARALYREYLKVAPKGPRRVQALYYLGWLPYDRGEYENALPDLNNFLRLVRHDRLRSYIVWAKGWSLFKLKRYREALEVFDAMARGGNALVAGKALYWGGMAHHALGDAKEAIAWMREVIGRYPLTYYAVLAAKRLHEWAKAPLPVWMVGPAVGLPDPEPFWPMDRLPPALARALAVVRDLSDVGEVERARRVYRANAREIERRFRGPEKARLLWTVHDAIEDYHALYERAPREFGHAMGRIPTKASALYWMLYYPRAHRDLIRVLSRRFEMPEHWAYAIMRQESRYRARQVSYTAALGIMQMIPKTAKVVSAALGVPFEVEGFFEAGRNLLFGNYYLAALARDFKGQIVFASAAYNAGAPPVKRFLARHRGLGFDEMVEHISYNEARNYCRMVASHLIRYAYLHLPPKERADLYRRLFPDAVDYDLGSDVNY